MTPTLPLKPYTMKKQEVELTEITVKNHAVEIWKRTGKSPYELINILTEVEDTLHHHHVSGHLSPRLHAHWNDIKEIVDKINHENNSTQK